MNDVASVTRSSRLPDPLRRPVYRIDRSFEWNLAHGPSFDGPWPALPELPMPALPMTEFFGLPVRSRFGIAASLVLDARWLALYSRLGFDLLTYKTVRCAARIAHPWPNWRFLEAPAPAWLDDPDAALRVSADRSVDPLLATAVGSIGMPSAPPEFWQADIAQCRARLTEGQVLIVSIVATAAPAMTEDAFVAEFETLAAMVRAAGAQLVEANLSCPNVQRREGEVYRAPALAARIAAAVRRGAGDLPVLLKVGPIEDDAGMAALLQAASGHADGVVMINAPSRRILDAEGAPAFGAGRERAGVMGREVHRLALDCVRRAARLIAGDALGLKLIAVGGASSPARVQAFLDAGAYAVQAASAAAWDPYLALRVKQARRT
jgi:dihydroorotate dehydrogenase (NAD+) catalytic subunit